MDNQTAQKVNMLFGSRLKVANVGVEMFAQAFQDQDTACVQVNWKPVAGGDKNLADILAKLNKK